MIIKSCKQTPLQTVQMRGARAVRMQVLLGRDESAPNFALRRFVVEPAGHTPRHQHLFEHEVFVLSGRGEVYDQQSGKRHPIAAGDAVLVPTNVVHQFINTGDEPLEFLCIVPLQQTDCQPVPGT